MQNVYPIFTFHRSMPEKLPVFLDFAPTFEKLPLFSRKWVRAWYTFWSGVGWPGGFPEKYPVMQKIVSVPWRPHGDYRVVHCHDDVMTWKHCLSYWPFVMRIHWSLVVLFTKCHHCGVLIFSLMYQPSPNGFLWVRYHLPGITLHSISFVLLHFSHSPRHL